MDSLACHRYATLRRAGVPAHVAYTIATSEERARRRARREKDREKAQAREERRAQLVS